MIFAAEIFTSTLIPLVTFCPWWAATSSATTSDVFNPALSDRTVGNLPNAYIKKIMKRILGILCKSVSGFHLTSPFNIWTLVQCFFLLLSLKNWLKERGFYKIISWNYLGEFLDGILVKTWTRFRILSNVFSQLNFDSSSARYKTSVLYRCNISFSVFKSPSLYPLSYSNKLHLIFNWNSINMTFSCFLLKRFWNHSVSINSSSILFLLKT